MATEHNLTGWESGTLGEPRFAGTAISGGMSVPNSGARTGTYRLQITTVNSVSNLVQMPAGAITGTSGTVAAGQHKRVRARTYLRIDNQIVPFGSSQIRIFGLGADLAATSINVWMDGFRKLTVEVGSGIPPIGGAGYAVSVASITTLGCIGASNVAQASCAAPHGFQTGASILIAGASNALYNGTVVITVTSLTTFIYTIASFQAPTGGTITGTYVSGPTLSFLGAIDASPTWYRVILDVDYLVGATTDVTVTLQVTTDGAAPAYDQSLTITANIGASDAMGKVTFLSERIRGAFDYHMTLSADDLSYRAASDADAVSQLTLPTETKVFPVPATAIGRTPLQVDAGPDQTVSRLVGATLAGVVTPSVGNTWGGTVIGNVNEIPVDLSGGGSRGAFFESSNGSGSLVVFTHATAAVLGITSIAAWRVYRNGCVASGTGSIDTLLGVLAQAGTWGILYPDVDGAQTPVGLIAWTPYTLAQFNATTFGVRKQNGTQQTFLGNILSEVLGE